MPTFYSYFKENMDALGLPAPMGLYANAAAALSTASALSAFIEKFGAKVTLAELIGAGIRAEQLLVVGTMSASFYTGAVIGSIAVALGRTLSRGTTLADVLELAFKNSVQGHWLNQTLAACPGIYNQRINKAARSSYQVYA